MKFNSVPHTAHSRWRCSLGGLALAALMTIAPTALAQETMSASSAQIPAPAGTGSAQTKPDGQQRGFVLTGTFEGSSNREGQVTDLNTSSGYNFNKHFGVDLGVPFYFLHSSATGLQQGSTSSTGWGLGNVYADARLAFPSRLLSYGTTFTVAAPTGDKNKGLSSGHATWNWGNHFDHAFGRLTPFVDAGVGNTIADTPAFHRAFVSFGHVAQFEGGTGIDLWGPFSLSASLYAVAPSGNQIVFSRVVRSTPTATPAPTPTPGRSANRRPFETTAITTGGADLTRDNGYNIAVDISPRKFLDFEVGYSRSVPLQLNTVSFSVGFIPTEMFRGNHPH